MGAGVWVGFVVSYVAWLLVARYLLRFGREDVEPRISGAERPARHKVTTVTVMPPRPA